MICVVGGLRDVGFKQESEEKGTPDEQANAEDEDRFMIHDEARAREEIRWRRVD